MIHHHSNNNQVSIDQNINQRHSEMAAKNSRIIQHKSIKRVPSDEIGHGRKSKNIHIKKRKVHRKKCGYTTNQRKSLDYN